MFVCVRVHVKRRKDRERELVGDNFYGNFENCFNKYRL